MSREINGRLLLTLRWFGEKAGNAGLPWQAGFTVPVSSLEMLAYAPKSRGRVTIMVVGVGLSLRQRNAASPDFKLVLYLCRDSHRHKCRCDGRIDIDIRVARL